MTTEQNSVAAESVRASALETVKRAILARYQKRFWLSLAAYSGVMLLIILVFILLKDSRVWYAYDPWFSILYVLKTAFPFIMAALWLGGAALLLYIQWRQSASDIVGLVDSIEQMQTKPEGSVITTPKNLTEFQPILQEMFNRASEDRRNAREAEQKRNDLILYLAHDLRTPLTSVVGYLSLLDEEAEALTSEQRASYLHIAREKALRLQSLIEQFFEISRLSLHQAVLDKSKFTMNVLLEQLVDEFFPLLEEKGMRIDVQASQEIEMYGDASMLVRVFSNIIKNALVYGAAKSIITVVASCEAGRVVVTVTNQGQDIPKERLAAIFDKFIRLDEARATDSGGAGLGLAIAKEIIVRHEGTIQVMSEGGTTIFTVVLPQQ